MHLYPDHFDFLSYNSNLIYSIDQRQFQILIFFHRSLITKWRGCSGHGWSWSEDNPQKIQFHHASNINRMCLKDRLAMLQIPSLIRHTCGQFLHIYFLTTGNGTMKDLVKISITSCTMKQLHHKYLDSHWEFHTHAYDIIRITIFIGHHPSPTHK